MEKGKESPSVSAQTRRRVTPNLPARRWLPMALPPRSPAPKVALTRKFDRLSHAGY